MKPTIEELTEWNFQHWIKEVLNENWKLEGGL